MINKKSLYLIFIFLFLNYFPHSIFLYANTSPIKGVWSLQIYAKYGKYFAHGRNSKTIQLIFKKNRFVEKYYFHGIIKSRHGNYKIIKKDDRRLISLIYDNIPAITFPFNIIKNKLWILGEKYLKTPDISGMWYDIKNKSNVLKLKSNKGFTLQLKNKRKKGKWLYEHSVSGKKILSLRCSKGIIKEYTLFKKNKNYFIRLIGSNIVYKKHLSLNN